MRTTVNIDDDLLHAARSIARLEERSLGDVLSALVRRGLAPPNQGMEEEEGFPVFAVSAETPPLTPDQVYEALEGKE